MDRSITNILQAIMLLIYFEFDYIINNEQMT